MKQYSRAFAKIDLDAILYNMEQLKLRIGSSAQLIIALKVDGYGHGAVPIAHLFENRKDIWGYATATLEEALALRKNHIKKPILVLGCIFPEQYEEMILYNIRATVYTPQMAKDMADTAKRLGKTAYIHIKIDTGMGRLGFFPKDESIQAVCEIYHLPHIEVEGLFTHFARADETDQNYTTMQHERFLWMEKSLKERGVNITYCHCDNSAGIINFPNIRHRLARTGISIYGMYPSEETCHKSVILKPALELISHVTFVKEVEAGAQISYGGLFTAQKNMRVATIPVGYGDGYSRGLSNKAEVLIHGKRAKIVGRVCMDQFMVDVTDIPDVQFMDQVVLIGSFGEEHICVEELSSLCGRFNYEFVCCLGKRVPRVYIQSKQIVEQIEYI